MDEIKLILQFLIPFTTLLFGFWARSLFDTRDLKRKILDEPFKQFDKVANELKENYRRAQLSNKNDKNIAIYIKYLNNARESLDTAKLDMICAARKIRNNELEKMVGKASESLWKAITGHDLFTNEKPFANDSATRRELIIILDEANKLFDAEFPQIMTEIYNQYWRLVTRLI